MKTNHNILGFLCLSLGIFFPFSSLTAQISKSAKNTITEELIIEETEENDSTEIKIIEPEDLFESIETFTFKKTPVNKSFTPRVFHGYRHLKQNNVTFQTLEYFRQLEPLTNDSVFIEEVFSPDGELISSDTIPEIIENIEIITETPMPEPDIDILNPGLKPKWLRDALASYRLQEDFIYSYMIENPKAIEYAYWDLPVPPQLNEDDVTFIGYIKRLKLPEVDVEKAILPEEELQKRHWLHKVNSLLQFSQAFVSPNWYQGGNDYLALLFNFNWNVQLNQVYHPNILFQSNLSYKLALSSNQKGSYHKYTISEDLFQYNLNTGLKAFKNWFYSFNALFKTQLLNNYEANSDVRTASFLSPGELNLGLGMAYSHQNKLKTFQMTATISPLSYNLKTCITDKINHELYNVPQNRKTKSEIGSNAEINMNWNITTNISYKTRLFLFTDYSYFLSDWENTFSFEINKFLSTQIYVHLRYDTSSENTTSWKKFMMREILSFGLSYTFSTKP